MRAFISVDIQSEELLNAIAKLQSDLRIKASAVHKQNMHFTLFFLGEISEEAADGVKKSLSEITFKPIEARFTHLGAFPDTKRPRVIWIGVDDVSSKKLLDLAFQVEQKISPLGFRQDKPFKPHLTIFRVKNKIYDISKTLERSREINLGAETLSELKLKQSVLTSNGPIYSDLLVVRAQ